MLAVTATEREGVADVLLVPVSNREPVRAAEAEKRLLKVPGDNDAINDAEAQPEALCELLLVMLCIDALVFAEEIGVALASGEGDAEVVELALGEGGKVRDRSAVSVAAPLCIALREPRGLSLAISEAENTLLVGCTVAVAAPSPVPLSRGEKEGPLLAVSAPVKEFCRLAAPEGVVR